VGRLVSSSQLPTRLAEGLRTLGWRMRWARLLRGLALLGLAAGGLFLAAGASAAAGGLPVAALRLANLVLIALGVGIVAVTAGAVCRSLREARLAALVEARHPQLGERLVSVVELHGAGTADNPALLRHLDEETTRLANDLDFRDAYPLTRTRRLMLAAGVVALAALLPGLVSDDYRRGQRRLLYAWSPTIHGYDIAVQPGHHVVGRGRAATVSVRLTRLEDSVRLPTFCTLVVEEPDGASRRFRMEAAEPGEEGALAHTLAAVETSARYWVETADLASEVFDLTVVEPIVLAAGTPKVEVTPPPYVVPESLPVVQRSGQTPFTALQYSRVRFDFEFDRPAQRATVRGKQAAAAGVIELPLSDGGRRARWEFVAAEPGPHSAELVVEAEHGVTWVHPLPAWSVWIDMPPLATQAPSLANLSADGGPRRIAPDDVLPIKAAFEDQVGLGEVVLEYAVGAGPTIRQTLADGKGRLSVAIDQSLPLRGKAKDGETLKVRLSVSDNRRLAKGEVAATPPLPEQELEPQVIHIPPQDDGQPRWWTFQVEGAADPLHKQEIVAERDALNVQIEQVKKAIANERQQVQKVAKASHQQPVLTAAQTAALASARKANAGIQQDLRTLAQTAALKGMEPLARLTSEIAGKEMAQAAKALDKGATKGQRADEREQSLRQADEALAAALKRLDGAVKLNEMLAQERLDVKEIEQLAQQEAELAKRAEALANDPEASKQDLEQLRTEQDKLAEAFGALLARNPRLQPVLQAQRRARAQELARQAQQLAMAQRKAAKNAEDAELAELKKQAADLVKLQRELAQRVATLDKSLKEQPATATLAAPHQPARDAADALAAARIEATLAKQRDTEQQLNRLAEQLDRTLALEGDPRAAANRLARMQDDLIKQLEKLGEEFVRIPIEQTRSRLAELTQAQRTLREALAKVEAPKTAAHLHTSADILLQQAAELLHRKDALAAHQHMEQARDALQQLASASPAVPPAPPPDTPVDHQLKKHADEARAAAKEQRQLAEAVRKLLADRAARRGNDPLQQKLDKDLARLAQELKDFAKQSGKADKEPAQSAASAAALAQKAMDKSRADETQGMLSQAKAGKSEAAQQLDMAGKKLEETAAALGKPGGDQDNAMDQALRQAAEEAQQQLSAAQQQLEAKGREAPAQMQKAAKALQGTAQKAAQALGPRAGPPPPAGDPAQAFSGTAPSGAAPADVDLKSLAGKTWGELPGELRTRIVQDLRARYGDDYGAIIQRYFQQIAAPPR
jgi:hypothetical protein